MMFKVTIVRGQLRGLIHSQAVMIGNAKQRPVTGRLDRIKEATDFILGQVCGKGSHKMFHL
jgi:hypothetical protein